MTYAFDPELAAAIPMLPTFDLSDLPAVRAHIAEFRAKIPAPDTAGVYVEDRPIPGRDGDPDVTLRIYRPQQQVALAVIYHVHGGGFILGDLDRSCAQPRVRP